MSYYDSFLEKRDEDRRKFDLEMEKQIKNQIDKISSREEIIRIIISGISATERYYAFVKYDQILRKEIHERKT